MDWSEWQSRVEAGTRKIRNTPRGERYAEVVRVCQALGHSFPPGSIGRTWTLNELITAAIAVGVNRSTATDAFCAGERVRATGRALAPLGQLVDEERLRASTDAEVWATEFCNVHFGADQDDMRAWFANAIEVARDAAAQALKAEMQALIAERDRLGDNLAAQLAANARLEQPREETGRVLAQLAQERDQQVSNNAALIRKLATVRAAARALADALSE